MPKNCTFVNPCSSFKTSFFESSSQSSTILLTHIARPKPVELQIEKAVKEGVINPYSSLKTGKNCIRNQQRQ